MDLLPAVNMSITTVVVKETTEVQDDDDISFEVRLDDTKDLSNLSNIVTFSIELAVYRKVGRPGPDFT